MTLVPTAGTIWLVAQDGTGRDDDPPETGRHRSTFRVRTPYVAGAAAAPLRSHRTTINTVFSGIASRSIPPTHRYFYPGELIPEIPVRSPRFRSSAGLRKRFPNDVGMPNCEEKCIGPRSQNGARLDLRTVCA